jgi:hypothetical protein
LRVGHCQAAFTHQWAQVVLPHHFRVATQHSRQLVCTSISHLARGNDDIVHVSWKLRGCFMWRRRGLRRSW